MALVIAAQADIVVMLTYIHDWRQLLAMIVNSTKLGMALAFVGAPRTVRKSHVQLLLHTVHLKSPWFMHMEVSI